MKIARIVLAGTTALTLSMTAASANENRAYLDQNGANNSALVTQSGHRNAAGADGLAMTQQGFLNQLTILQSGDRNKIGLEGGGIVQDNGYDIGTTFVIDITQSSNRNEVGAIKQFASGDASSGLRNSAVINQGGLGNNRVGSVYQERKSSGKNMLTVEQTGFGDRLETVYQRSNTGENSPNQINVTMSGLGNGTVTAGNRIFDGGLSGFAAGSGAQASSLKQGDLDQTSRGNKITLVVTGVSNDFGVTQNGRDNTVGTLNLGGVTNELGINQHGNNNTIGLAAVDGVSNNIGISQLGDTHNATVSVVGSFNQMGVLQSDTSNSATVLITGVNNGLAPNLWGTANWSGSALEVASLNPMLDRGMLKQIGESNLASLTVTGNSNAFGVLQHGNSNTLTGVQDGSYNQAAVVQVGNANTTSFTQIGSGNTLGVSQ